MRKSSYRPETPLVALVLGLALLVIPFSLTQGCKSAPKNAYVTANTATITVEAAMKLWDTYVSQQHPSVATEVKVKAAYDAYRAADIALLKAGKAMLEAQSDANTTSWKQAEAALTASANDVYNLLKSLGVKLP